MTFNLWLAKYRTQQKHELDEFESWYKRQLDKAQYPVTADCSQDFFEQQLAAYRRERGGES